MADINELIGKIRNSKGASGRGATGEEMRVWIAETFEALESGLSKTSTAILSGGNLNNYADPGDYYCDSTTICNSLTNCPVTNRVFFLAVKQSSVTSYRRVQILIAHYTSTSASYGGGKPSIYARARYTASSWGAWVQVYTSNDTIPGIAEAQTAAVEAKTTANGAATTASEAKDKAVAAYDLALSVGASVGATERGTWTPTANEVYRYDYRSGSYVLSGGVVIATFSLVYQATSSTIESTNISIRGLPYVASADAWGLGAMSGSSFPSGSSPNSFYIPAGVANIVPKLTLSNGQVISATTTGQSQYFIFQGSILYPIP